MTEEKETESKAIKADPKAKEAIDEGGMHGYKLALVFLGLALSMFVSSLSETIASTALPTIVGDLGGVEIMQWVSTTFILASTVTMPIYGKLGDKMGRKGLLILALGLYAAGKGVCGITPNMGGLILGRAISGLGGGGLIILSQAILADVVSARARGKYMGAIGAIFAASNVLGPVLGGWFVQVTGWRMIFWFTIPLAVISMIICGLFLPKSKSKQRTSIDGFGMATLTIAIVSLVLATSWGGDQFPWLSWQIIGLFALTIASTTAFVFIERKVEEPIIPMSLFKNRNFVLCTICGALIYAGFDGAVNYLPTFLQIVDNETPEIAGLMMVPLCIGSLLTSTVTGFIASATGKYKWMLISMGAVSTIGFALMSTMGDSTPAILTMLYFFIVGFGLGLGSQILVLVVQNEFPHSIVGTATAANNCLRQIGSTLGTAVVGSVFTMRLTNILSGKLPASDHLSVDTLTPDVVDKLSGSLRETISSGYTEALIPIFAVCIPMFAVATILMCFIKKHPLSNKVDNTGTQTKLASKTVSDNKKSTKAE